MNARRTIRNTGTGATFTLSLGNVAHVTQFDIVHHGGLGVAAWALALGVPQLVLPNDLEKHVVGQALAAAGAGVALSARASAESVARGIEALSRLETSPIARIAPSRDDALATRLAITEACEGLVAGPHERSTECGRVKSEGAAGLGRSSEIVTG